MDGPIRRLLVANRSEIAIRIFRAATEMGIRTFAVYAEENKLSLHRFQGRRDLPDRQGRGPLQAYLSKLNSCLQASVNSLRGSRSSLLC